MRTLVSAFMVFGLLLALGNMAYALQWGRISWGRSFTKVLWAKREDNPDLFWLMVGLNALVCAGLVWLLLADSEYAFRL